MITETELFYEIFEDFIYLDNDIEENELWKSNSIIKLMQVSYETENKKIIEDGLKIILNLCNFNECGDLMDSYESESHSVTELMESEKNICKSILLAEFS